MKDKTSDSTRQLNLGDSLVQTLTSRRSFLKVALGSSGALTVSMIIPGCGGQVVTGINKEKHWVANAWLEILPNNDVKVTLDRVEMGQGTYTGITTLVAEELDVNPESIQVVFAPVAKEYRNPEYGVQVTGGSNSIKSSWVPIREAAATARHMIVSAAAQVWQVDPEKLITDDRKVKRKGSEEVLSFGELISLAARQSMPSKVTLKSPDRFKYIGKHSKRLDSRLKVTGNARYGIDAEIEGMQYAVVIHSPTIGGKVKMFDASKVKRMTGIVDVIAIAAGVAVVANSYWQARSAAQKLSVDWAIDPKGPKSTEQIFEYYREAAKGDDGKSSRSDGNFGEALKASRRTIEREYEIPFLAHATMEPMNCLAHVTPSGADIWVGTQAPDIARIAVAKVTDLSPDDVRVHSQFIGGGFGRRLIQDYISEAAEISFKLGLPIKLVWSREDDMQNDYYRPASFHRLKATLESDGTVTGWDHHIVVPRLLDWYIGDAGPAMFPAIPKFMYSTLSSVGLLTEGTLAPADTSPYEGANDLPYNIPNIEVRHTQADLGVPVSYWRSVGHSQNGFVVETWIDELAFEANRDPYEFRRELLSKQPKYLKVLDLVAQKANWAEPLPKGFFRGIAVHKSFNSFVAQVVELTVKSRQIKLRRVVCAVDCGTVINPDLVKMQMESGIIFGITAALFGEITLREGKVQQSNFHDYQMLRMNDAPEIVTVLVDSNESPTGVGEPGLPPIAPAIANALFAATGKRQYKLPLKI